MDADYFQVGAIGRVADELLENDDIENIIIVGIPLRSIRLKTKSTIHMETNIPHMFDFST